MVNEKRKERKNKNWTSAATQPVFHRTVQKSLVEQPQEHLRNYESTEGNGRKICIGLFIFKS